ncbi:uncharacterized protein LOC129595999 isoform X2 [Paramacrobiotus metropolitanus]|nr:uncharacterized protein LOC129595999 isoform X2 [Paramacrobiotus metropolitanus]XP_055349121.1 uncharacterized protein LOC129595999 isoform X2 [Paramacrobiotus metropolitanus]XP_055349123.1 uncharacterized protein LOC129595999 isoform X2 [Paramacrobiotus metropolitanus]
MRESFSGRWTWFPVEILSGLPSNMAHTPCQVAVVQWWNKTNNTTCTDIVPIERLRYRLPTGFWALLNRSHVVQLPRPFVSTRSWLGGSALLREMVSCVENGDYFKGSLQIPEVSGSISTEELLKRLNSKKVRSELAQFCEVSFVEILERQLSYIVYRYRTVDDGKKAGTPRVAATHGEEFHRRLIEHIARMQTDPIPTDTFGALPVKLWQEVLSHLDTLTQTKVRAVCPLWNSILDLPLLTANILISNSGSDKQKSLSRIEYDLLSPIYRCLSSATQRIVIVNQRRMMDVNDFFVLVPNMIQWTVKQNSGVHLKAIHWVNLQCRLLIRNRADSIDYHECVLHRNTAMSTGHLSVSTIGLPDFIESCRKLPCKAIQLHSCVINLEWMVSGPQFSQIRLIVPIHIPRMRLETTSDFDCAVWDALEAALPAPSSDELQILSKWIQSSAAGEYTSTNGRLLCWAMCAMHTADPRPSSHYRGKKWCVAGLQDLQLEKLSRLTQHFCIKLAKLRG